MERYEHHLRDDDGPAHARWVMRWITAIAFTFVLGLAIGWTW